MELSLSTAHPRCHPPLPHVRGSSELPESEWESNALRAPLLWFSSAFGKELAQEG